jgi:anti-sigma-K factor RskA
VTGPIDNRGNVHGDNGQFVSLREYIERILEERDKAVQVAYRNLEQRLDKLNELRAEVQQDRGQFLRLDVYDEKHDQLRKALTDMEDRLEVEIKNGVAMNSARLDNLDSWRLKAGGAFLILVPLAGLIGAAIMKAFG